MESPTDVPSMLYNFSIVFGLLSNVAVVLRFRARCDIKAPLREDDWTVPLFLVSPTASTSLLKPKPRLGSMYYDSSHHHNWYENDYLHSSSLIHIYNGLPKVGWVGIRKLTLRGGLSTTRSMLCFRRYISHIHVFHIVPILTTLRRC